MRGTSTPFGFHIYDEKNKSIVVEDKLSLLKFVLMMSVISILLVQTQVRIIEILLFILSFAYIIKICYLETSQWHAIEHKLIYLLEHECVLTEENFEKASMKHERCGIRNIMLARPKLKKINIAIKAGNHYLQNKE